MSPSFHFLTESYRKHQYYVGNHYHDCYEIIYYIDGCGKTTIDDKVFDFKQNTFAITSPGIIHNETGSVAGIKLMYMDFSINDERFILKNGVFQDDESKEILKLIVEMRNETKNKMFHSQDLINSLLLTLIIKVLRIQNKDYVSVNRTNFDQIETYIKNNCNKRINGKIVAKDIGYNYDYFRKIFKKHFKISLNDYINNAKMENAIVLLNAKKYSISEISTLIGFSSPSHFISIFKAKYGITPSEYQKQNNLDSYKKDFADYKIFDR